MINKVEKLKNLIRDAKSIAVITGAGISTASGIPDIRGKDGAANNPNLKRKYHFDYETIVSAPFFFSHTEEFYKYYKEQMIFKNSKPNIAHEYLAKLEKEKDVTIITQNIDGLHRKAGSKKVIEVHGTVLKNKCLICGKEFDLDDVYYSENIVPICDTCGGLIKPEVVLFGESLDEFAIEASLEALQKADLLLIIGSSLVVYPVAAFPSYYRGTKMIIINKDPTPLDSRATLVINENISEIIKELENE